MKQKTDKLECTETTLSRLTGNDLLKQYTLHVLEPEKYPLSEIEVATAKNLMDKRYEARQSLNEFDATQQLNALLKINQSAELAAHSSHCVKPTNPLEQMLIDQMSSLHIAGMGMLSHLNSNKGLEFEAVNKITNATCKLFKCYQDAMQTLHDVRNGGKQVITVKHQNVQVNGGQALITNTLQSLSQGGEDEK